ncbi:MAG TPA: biotin--[acetyl-CoA-carboxylase] ligase [Rhodothermales bacterium]
MAYNNTYTHGQLWAQARAAGRDLQARLEPLLETSRFGRSIASYVEIGSTNAVAIEWAAEGAAEGALVIADHQTDGRGRLGRTWQDVSGKNLMFSIVLRPTLRPEDMGLIMLAAAVAVSHALERAAENHSVRIKWPNDVLLNGRKCCGMLMESTSSGAGADRPRAAVVGIGVNVNQASFPDGFAYEPTSLALETGQLYHRTPILGAILNGFERNYDGLARDGGASLRDAYRARMKGIGDEVTVYPATAGTAIRGVIRGIADNGALMIETLQGMQALSSGDVTFRRAEIEDASGD